MTQTRSGINNPITDGTTTRAKITLDHMDVSPFTDRTIRLRVDWLGAFVDRPLSDNAGDANGEAMLLPLGN